MATLEILAEVPLFGGLTPEEIRNLGALLRRRRYAKGEVIFHEGDAGTELYIIESGEVKIVLGSAEGQEVVIGLLGRGDFFGELALLDGEPRSANAVAREACDLFLLGRKDFLQFLVDEPQVAVTLLAVLSRRLRQTDQIVHDAAFLDVRARLVKVLLNLAQTRGQASARGIIIRSRLTQGDLANMVGATRESINKWLRFYERQGLVHHYRGRLTLPDLEHLREEVS
jgi:CRP/FNR family transcriptional regulator, cyclic AMP receptor protein